MYNNDVNNLWLEFCCRVSYDRVTQRDGCGHSHSCWTAYLIQHWAHSQPPPIWLLWAESEHWEWQTLQGSHTHWQRRFTWTAHVTITETSCYNKTATKGGCQVPKWLKIIWPSDLSESIVNCSLEYENVNMEIQIKWCLNCCFAW